MTTLTHSDAVTYYAAQVRAALEGLDREVIDDLTDGLEADLTETVLDELWVEGSATPKSALTSLDEQALIERFGPPAEYAAELAAAAEVEIPQPTTAKRPALRERLAQSRGRVRAGMTAFVERHGWAREGFAMLRAMRPVWWAVRGWGLYVIVISQVLRVFDPTQWVPRNPVNWIICLVAVGLSVQYGRKKFWQGKWGRRGGRLASVASVIAVLIAISSILTYLQWRMNPGTYASSDADAAYWAGMEARSDGVFVNGESATNLFVYDAQGQPVEDARIVDQKGRWVVLANPEDGTRWNYVEPEYLYWSDEAVPTFFGDPSQPPNVFPYTYLWYDITYDGQSLTYDDEGQILMPDPTGRMEPGWPQASLAPLAEPGAVASEPSGVADATPEPSSDATPEPTADPSATE